MSRGRFICLCIVLLLFSACASKPGRELTEAQRSLDLAESAEADLYSGEVYRAAAARLKEAEAEIAAQERKASFSRDFDRARQLLNQAKKDAERAAATATSNKEKTRTEAQSAEAGARNAVESARKALSSSGSRGLKRDLHLLTGDLKAAEVSLEEARSAYRDGRFRDALNEFLAAREKADAVTSDLQ